MKEDARKGSASENSKPNSESGVVKEMSKFAPEEMWPSGGSRCWFENTIAGLIE
ncbi:MAG: hypothetical protein ACREX9_00290 [Gammaproteobacteria bacterium]